MIRALALALCLVLALSACSEPEQKDDRLPDLTLSGFDGGDDVDLGELTGPAVISIWASWCGPCRKEMPALQEFHAAYGDEVSLLGIDFQDRDTAGARALVEKSGVTYPLVSDELGDINGEGAFPLLRGLPYLAFVDDDGTVTEVEAGAIDSADELVDLVDEHLGIRL